MSGPGLRKLVGGHIIDISHSKVPRVIGKGGSMISLIKKYTRCRMFVGQNGRIWIDGEPEEIFLAAKAIEKIENEAHVIGLTDAMNKYLSEEVKKIRGEGAKLEEVEDKSEEEDIESLEDENEDEVDEGKETEE
jgi:exosome complex component RRP4